MCSEANESLDAATHTHITFDILLYIYIYIYTLCKYTYIIMRNITCMIQLIQLYRYPERSKADLNLRQRRTSV